MSESNGGRPPLFSTDEELQKKIEEYFKSVPTKKVVSHGQILEVPVPTITGLALHLGFASRQSFYDYEQKEDFTYTIKRARLMIENQYEMSLSSNSPTGAIFALKNMGWSDQQDVNLMGNITLNIDEDDANL